MTNEQLLCQSAVNTWKLFLGRFDKKLASLSNEQLQQQVAPGRNRIFYLLGHLTVVHDRMLPMLSIGERLHPEWDAAYLDNPDQSLPDPASADELRHAWAEVNGKLTAAFERFTPAEWLSRHTAVSEEDFAKDPTRNRLTVAIGRSSHMAFHLGQIILVK